MSDNKYSSYFDENEKEKDDNEFQTPFPKKKKYREGEIENIESFNSMDDLNNKYGGNYDYEVLDENELKNILVESVDESMFNCISPDENEEMDQEVLEEDFKEDPFDYNILYKLIHIYRETNQTEKLKEIREHTLKYFPISDKMWTDWINDEMKKIKDNDDKYKIIDFIKKAFSDFYYMKICRKFLKFLIKLKDETKDENDDIQIVMIRKYFEEFLTFWGLDFNYSNKIYDLYISFEKKNLENFKKINDNDNITSTINLIRSIYRRRLSFPHIDLDIVWKEYKQWEFLDYELKRVDEKYKESSQNVEYFLNLEENFNELTDWTRKEDDPSKLILFFKKEVSKLGKKHFNYVRLYFERALEMLCDYYEIWELYINMVTTMSKDKELIFSTLKRATRCCYNHIEFWIMLFKEMEKRENDSNMISAKINEAYLSSTDQNFKYEIWKFSLEYYIRNFDNTLEQLTIIRSYFESAINEVKNFSEGEEMLKRIYFIWNEFETYKVRDKSKMNELMEKIIRKNRDTDAWQLYITYEKYFGDISSIRKVYKRAIEYCKDNKELFSHSWIQWEKIFGNVNDIDSAINYTKGKNLKKLKLGKRDKSPEINKIEKTKLKINNNHKTVIVKNLTFETTEENISNFIKEEEPSLEIDDIRIVKDRKGNSRGFAFIDFTTPKMANRFVKILNNKILNGNIISCAISRPPSLGENDKRTIFINNISFNSTEDSIQDAFKKYGDILDIRIISDSKTNKPKGYCYIEFMEEESVEKIMSEVESNGFILDERKVIIKRSQSVAKLREKIKHVCHISNLNFKTKENDMKSFLITNGISEDSIIEILIIKDDDGKSKGFGFIELRDEDNFMKVLQLKGKIIKGRPVSIKESQRNITKSKKRKSDLPLEEIKPNKKAKQEEVLKEKQLDNSDFKKYLK